MERIKKKGIGHKRGVTPKEPQKTSRLIYETKQTLLKEFDKKVKTKKIVHTARNDSKSVGASISLKSDSSFEARISTR